MVYTFVKGKNQKENFCFLDDDDGVDPEICSIQIQNEQNNA